MVSTGKIRRLGQFLREKRIHKKFTQMEAALTLGHSTAQYISNFERGLCEPSIETAIKLCKFYCIGKRELYELMINIYKIELKEKIFANEAGKYDDACQAKGEAANDDSK